MVYAASVGTDLYSPRLRFWYSV